MEFEYYNEIKIFRPRVEYEFLVKNLAENNLRKKYDVGTYSDKDTILSVIRHQFSFYQDKFDQYLKKIITRDFLDFILTQYDSAADVHSLYRKKQLPTLQMESWKELGPIFRRALKFIAERTTLIDLNYSIDLDEKDINKYTDLIFIYAEEIIKHYIISDEVLYLYPETSELEILPPDQEFYYTIKHRADEHFIGEIYRDASHRGKEIDQFFNEKFVNIEFLGNHLDSAMNGLFDVGFNDALEIINSVIEDTKALENYFPSIFVRKDILIKNLSLVYKISEKNIESIINSFSIRRENMIIEKR